MKGNNDNLDDLLDVGSALKKEKTFKENQEKVAKLKAEHRSEGKEANESSKEEKHALSKFAEQKASMKQIGLFLLLIILITVGTRMYVASMPITEQWAELVVTENIKTQVT